MRVLILDTRARAGMRAVFESCEAFVALADTSWRDVMRLALRTRRLGFPHFAALLRRLAVEKKHGARLSASGHLAASVVYAKIALGRVP